jgi:hypothetical protein
MLPFAAFGAAPFVSRGVATPELFKAIHRVQGIALHYRDSHSCRPVCGFHTKTAEGIHT